ncbi:hypothetical protein HDC37_000326 [Microbacterium sp. AK009]|uniref:hypothetical protein n=1 Tax=Microbacterium sp. AK009 TaxID=2723068 RepID=UPI001792179C|nr:hypothetical protein [Microbacterium sp. AK009]NYF15514.1 hypothetical protein [Microbacterium sp. AK009]
MTRRRWIGVGAVTAVVAGLAVAAAVLGAQQSAREERLATAEADFSAFIAARSDWESNRDEYVSAVLTTAAESAVYSAISEKVQTTAAAFDPDAIAGFERAVSELSAITPSPLEGQDVGEWEKSVLEDPAATIGLEEPTLPTLIERDVVEAYAADDEASRAVRASVTGAVSALSGATAEVTAAREELEAAHQRAIEAGTALAAATTLLPDTVLAESALASDDSKATFVAAHATLGAFDTGADAQELFEAVTGYLASHAALRASNDEAVAEAERIRREQVGTITVRTDFMYYLPYDQCIQAPGVAYTQTFDVSGGQNHTTAPDPAQDFDIWTYTISGGTVSYLRCYAD